MSFIALATKGQLPMYYTYVLKSEKHEAYYYGSTSDVKIRLSAHNAGKNASTVKYRPWKIIWYAAFETKGTAQAFEKYLKSASGKAFLRKRLIQ